MSDSDKQSAVSALAACGEDIAQLEAAVSKYTWLEDHPGPHRQKWRLARGKVQRAKTPSKIVRVGAGNAEAEDSSSSTERLERRTASTRTSPSLPTKTTKRSTSTTSSGA